MDRGARPQGKIVSFKRQGKQLNPLQTGANVLTLQRTLTELNLDGERPGPRGLRRAAAPMDLQEGPRPIQRHGDGFVWAGPAPATGNGLPTRFPIHDRMPWAPESLEPAVPSSELQDFRKKACEITAGDGSTLRLNGSNVGELAERLKEQIGSCIDEGDMTQVLATEWKLDV